MKHVSTADRWNVTIMVRGIIREERLVNPFVRRIIDVWQHSNTLHSLPYYAQQIIVLSSSLDPFNLTSDREEALSQAISIVESYG